MTSGIVDPPWSEGAVNRGYKMYRQWSGADASAAERASGTLLPHPYSTLTLHINSPKIQWSRLSDPNTYFEGYVQELFGVIPQPSDPWGPNEWNSLVSELYSNVKGGDFNASVASAQLGQTLGGMANAATRIYRAYRAARKGHLRDAAVALTGANRKRLSNKAASKEMASNWLELQYGWLPLLGDVHSGSELLANYLHRPFTRVVRVRKQVSNSISGSSHGYWNWGSCKLCHQCQIVAILEEDLTGYQTLGLTDPLSVAWELVPYSFVLDWFLPIGPWLEAAAAARTLKGTFVVTHTKRIEGEGIYSGSVYTIQGGDSYLYTSVDVKRTIDSALSTEIPAFKPLAKAASLHHCLNALALLENLRR